MKKVLLTVVSISLSATMAFAQVNAPTKSKTYDYKSFSIINASSDFAITVVKGGTYSISVEAGEAYLPYLSVKNDGMVLSFSLDDAKLPKELKKTIFQKKYDFKATVTVPDKVLNGITLNDKATLIANDEFNSDAFIINVNDNAMLERICITANRVEVNTNKKGCVYASAYSDDLIIEQAVTSSVNMITTSKNIKARVFSSSTLNLDSRTETVSIECDKSVGCTLRGTAKKATFKCNGLTSIDASDMQIDEVDVDMTGYCKIKTTANKFMNINMAGGSLLEFKGEPSIKISAIKNSTVNRY